VAEPGRVEERLQHGVGVAVRRAVDEAARHQSRAHGLQLVRGDELWNGRQGVRGGQCFNGGLLFRLRFDTR
jgi:hypothetical protein